MSGGKTIIIKESLFDDDPPEKRHAALVVLKGEEIGRTFRLRKKAMIVGRGQTADIRLPDESASREHAVVEFREGDTTYVITDLGSTNKTIVNAVQVESTQLQEGDKIRIGDTMLKFVVLDDIEAKFHAEVRDLISYDQLTGLLTKESLYLAFERELRRCLQYRLPLAVLMMDHDHFKSVNDTHGHLMGSHVLGEVGKIIHQTFRSEDVSARYGGEEFITYLAETEVPGAEYAAERVRSAIEAYDFVLDDNHIKVTISIGVAIAPGHGTSIKELVARADAALYRAKESGRNRVCMA